MASKIKNYRRKGRFETRISSHRESSKNNQNGAPEVQGTHEALSNYGNQINRGQAEDSNNVGARMSKKSRGYCDNDEKFYFVEKQSLIDEVSKSSDSPLLSPDDIHDGNQKVPSHSPQLHTENSVSLDSINESLDPYFMKDKNVIISGNYSRLRKSEWQTDYEVIGKLANTSESLSNAKLDPRSELHSSSLQEQEKLNKADKKYLQNKSLLEGCRYVDIYEKLNKISEGTYGTVYRARSKETGDMVALKYIKYHEKNREAGFPMTALREISILLEFNHENIVNVQEVVVDNNNPNNVYLVMEYVEHELKLLLEQNRPTFSLAEKKTLLHQLLSGVAYMHSHWVIHRDLKTSNLLYSNKGVLKICDFGMARKFGDPIKPYTQNVVTLWYRAPELLLGETKYAHAVDMWSIGCIMGELLLRQPLFRGKNESDSLDKIFRLCGTPNSNNWPGILKLPVVENHEIEFAKHNPSWRKTFPYPKSHFTEAASLSDAGLDLLKSLLTLDPKDRIAAKDALNHPFFTERPQLQRPQLMPSAPDTNGFIRNNRVKERSGEINISCQGIRETENRFGTRVDPQRYLDELEVAAKQMKNKNIISRK